MSGGGAAARDLALCGCGRGISHPPIYVTRANPLPEDALFNEFRNILSSRWYTNNGPENRRLAAALQRMTGAAGCALVSSCHQALQLALEAVGVAHNPVWNEVITTPFTFPSTIEAILREGLRPVYCDVDPATGCLDPAGIEEKITQRTCCILPVHVYGNICDDDAIGAIAARHHLPVIYDAAHAFGETIRRDGREVSVMTLGTASCCSFHATKVFTTAEGGAVFSRAPEITRRVEELANFGLPRGWAAGTNAKMDEFHAAIGLCSLPYYDEMTAGRERRWKRYLADLSTLHDYYYPIILPQGVETNSVKGGTGAGADGTENVPGPVRATGHGNIPGPADAGGSEGAQGIMSGRMALDCPDPADVARWCCYIRRNYGYFPVLVRGCSGVTRDRVYEALRRENIHARKYFWPLVSEMQLEGSNHPCLWCGNRVCEGEELPGTYARSRREGDGAAGAGKVSSVRTSGSLRARRETPAAWYLASHVLCLPMYCDLPLEDVDRICRILRNVVKEREGQLQGEH